VRTRIKSRSNSASPPSTVSIKRPCGPCIAERSETGFPIGNRRERVQQVARRSRQPASRVTSQHVAGVELVEQAAKLRPVGLGAARHFAEHLARRA
jgi:hypothetical protein